MIEIIWYIAWMLWVSQAIPQIYKIYKTKKAMDLSYITIYMLIICTWLWSIYWYKLNLYPILYPNLLLGIFYCFLLILKIKYDKNIIPSINK